MFVITSLYLGLLLLNLYHFMFCNSKTHKLYANSYKNYLQTSLYL